MYQVIHWGRQFIEVALSYTKIRVEEWTFRVAKGKYRYIQNRQREWWLQEVHCIMQDKQQLLIKLAMYKVVRVTFRSGRKNLHIKLGGGQERGMKLWQGNK